MSYVYLLPTFQHASQALSAVANGWGIQGVTIAQSGQPFSVIDFSGTAASIFFSADDFITNPILPVSSRNHPQGGNSGRD